MNKIYQAKVSLCHEFEVIIGKNALTDDFIENFKKYYYDFDTIEEHIEHIGYAIFQYGTVRGLEEYPQILENGRNRKWEKIPEDELSNYINVIIKDDDNVPITTMFENKEELIW